MATTTFYSGSGDGYVNNQTTAGWSNCRNASSGINVDYLSSPLWVGSVLLTGGVYYISRAFLPFNTSSIPDDATIESAQLKIYVSTYIFNNSGGQVQNKLSFIQTTQASTSS